eukprot:29974-Pelagococcus_subviridis.AAC.15
MMTRAKASAFLLSPPPPHSVTSTRDIRGSVRSVTSYGTPAPLASSSSISTSNRASRPRRPRPLRRSSAAGRGSTRSDVGVERRCRGLKPWRGRKETPGEKVLKKRRSPRGRMGTVAPHPPPSLDDSLRVPPAAAGPPQRADEERGEVLARQRQLRLGRQHVEPPRRRGVGAAVSRRVALRRSRSLIARARRRRGGVERRQKRSRNASRSSFETGRLARAERSRARGQSP